MPNLYGKERRNMSEVTCCLVTAQLNVNRHYLEESTTLF